MDDSFLELENELKRLQPRQPPASLLASIEAELTGPANAQSGADQAGAVSLLFFRPRLNWQIIGAAAAVLVITGALLAVRHSTPRESITGIPPPIANGESPPAIAQAAVAPATSAPDSAPASLDNRYHPVGAASVLYDLREDGTDAPANHTPVHRLRYRYVDTYTWKNPATNASLKWSVPRDEVRVLPASLH